MPARIFIVEDHPLMRQLMVEFIENRCGLTVSGTAGTAEEALDQLASAGADLVLVDVSLPGMSGIDFVAQLQARSSASVPAPPCLMLSGHTEAMYAERALTAGASGYVTKGNPAALVASLSSILEQSGAESSSR